MQKSFLRPGGFLQTRIVPSLCLPSPSAECLHLSLKSCFCLFVFKCVTNLLCKRCYSSTSVASCFDNVTFLEILCWVDLQQLCKSSNVSGVKSVVKRLQQHSPSSNYSGCIATLIRLHYFKSMKHFFYLTRITKCSTCLERMLSPFIGANLLQALSAFNEHRVCLLFLCC